MKKILALVCAASLAVTLFGCSSGKGDSGDKVYTGTYSRDLEGTTLNVFNWGEYISDGSEDSFDVNKEFEKLTGIKVNYSYYDNNEAMYSKLKSGAVAYDIIIPSDYMIERLKNEGMLEKLDFSKLDNYKYISDEYKDLYFDENNEYSVPYNVGMVGLIYNKTMVEGEPTSWNIMWDSKYADDILTFNNPRDAFGIAQFLLGLDINSNDTADWDKAAAKLTEQNAVLQARVNDEVFNKIMSESTVKPAVLQIECHPYAQRLAMREKVKPYGIHVTCWFPLGGAMSNGALFKDPTIIAIAEAHGKSPAQIILRWHMQEGFSAIPGASNPDYIKENIEIFDFELTDDEMAQMRGLNKEERFFNMSLEEKERSYLGKMQIPTQHK